MALVGHYAPGCFALLLPTAGLADAIRVAERLREGFAEHSLSAQGEHPRLTLSVGVVQVAEKDDSISLLTPARSGPGRRRSPRRQSGVLSRRRAPARRSRRCWKRWTTWHDADDRLAEPYVASRRRRAQPISPTAAAANRAMVPGSGTAAPPCDDAAASPAGAMFADVASSPPSVAGADAALKATAPALVGDETASNSPMPAPLPNTSRPPAVIVTNPLPATAWLPPLWPIAPLTISVLPGVAVTLRLLPRMMGTAIVWLPPLLLIVAAAPVLDKVSALRAVIK